MTGARLTPPNTSVGYQQLTSDQLATVQPLTVPAGALRATLQSNGVQAVRWRDDGGDPVAPAVGNVAKGQRILPDDEYDYTGDLTRLRVIGEGAGSVLDIHYYA